MKYTFTGKVAVITGAASGIGYAITRYFAETGASVVGIDLAPNVVELMAELGENHLGLVRDLTRPTVATEILDHVVNHYGKVDILVNSAGIVVLEPALETQTKSWQATLDVNLSASFYMAQAAGRHMVPAGYGRIINLASQAAVVGLEDHVAYCSSKAAILGMTRALSLEWAPSGVTVNAVSPTIVETPLGKKAWAGEKGERAKEQIPTRRFAQPEEVAALVGFLASAEAAMITGSNQLIDGGYTST